MDLLGKKIFFVDDMAVSGETIKIAKKLLKKTKPKEIKTLTLARHKDSFLPNFCGLTSNDCIVCPWDRWVYNNNSFKMHPELSTRENK